MLKVLIVENEIPVQNTIITLLKVIDPTIEVVQTATTVNDAIKIIEKNTFDLVLLDVELDDGLSFEILHKLGKINFKIIFITSFEQYAINAFKYSACDYVVKPIQINVLKEAILKVKNNLLKDQALMLNTLLINSNNNEKPSRLIVHTMKNIESIEIVNIIRLEADDNYTKIHLKSGKRILSSKRLKEVVGQLILNKEIIRVHRSHAINLNYFKRFSKLTNTILLNDEFKIPLSKTYKTGFMEALEKF